jgi:hypothetical protein
MISTCKLVKTSILLAVIIMFSACSSKSPNVTVPDDDVIENVSDAYESITDFASFQSTPNTPPPAIIDDLKKLKPSKLNRNAFYYIQDDYDFSKYNSIEVEPVKMMILDEEREQIDKELVVKISKYFTEGLNTELNKVIKNNKGNKKLLLKSAFLSIDVSFDNLLPHQYMPFGLALKAALRSTDLEERKLRVHFALRILEKESKETIVMLLDKNIKDDVESYEDFTFKDIKPLLDIWIERYAQRLHSANTGEYR